VYAKHVIAMCICIAS